MDLDLDLQSKKREILERSLEVFEDVSKTRLLEVERNIGRRFADKYTR